MNLVGDRYGSLSVRARAILTDGRRGVYWHVQCDCGQKTIVRQDHLRSGRTISCGCAAKQNALVHGQTGTRLHNIWRGMLKRCDATSGEAFEKYAGRGISVCDEWRDFVSFADWANVNGYADDLTIERIDNDGNYCPDNCRWATSAEQARNRRNSRYETIGGIRKTLSEWCEVYRIPFSRVQKRLEAGWPLRAALTLPKSARYQT